MKRALFLSLMLVACSEPSNESHIEWTPMTPEEIRIVCMDTNASGCVKKDSTGCTIITPPMPMHEFTGHNYDMQSPVWRELAHETMHCLGYEHSPS